MNEILEAQEWILLGRHKNERNQGDTRMNIIREAQEWT